MSLQDLKEWLREFRDSPLRAILYLAAAITIIAFGIVFTTWITNRSTDYLKRTPFADLEGQYEGNAEGNKFKLCLKVFGNKVQGAMVWDESPDLIDYVDYEGTIKNTQVELTYKRNPKHPYPDNGVAIITPPENGLYRGY